MSEDPIGFEGGINFYAYVLNNPVNMSDAWGLVPSCACVATTTLVGAGTGAMYGAMGGGGAGALASGGTLTIPGSAAGGGTGAAIGGAAGFIGGLLFCPDAEAEDRCEWVKRQCYKNTVAKIGRRSAANVGRFDFEYWRCVRQNGC